MKKSRNHKELETVLSNLNAARADPDDGFVILSQSDADFLADRLNVYISGNVNTLDEAFGLKRGRGAPQNGPIYPTTWKWLGKPCFAARKVGMISQVNWEQTHVHCNDLLKDMSNMRLKAWHLSLSGT